MIKLNLDKHLKTLDGQILKEDGRPLKMFHAAANALVQAKGRDPIKCYDLAVRIFSGGPIDIDDSDLSLVRDVIDKSEFIPLVKGPLLKELDSVKLMAGRDGQPESSENLRQP